MSYMVTYRRVSGPIIEQHRTMVGNDLVGAKMHVAMIPVTFKKSDITEIAIWHVVERFPDIIQKESPT